MKQSAWSGRDGRAQSPVRHHRECTCTATLSNAYEGHRITDAAAVLTSVGQYVIDDVVTARRRRSEKLQRRESRTDTCVRFSPSRPPCPAKMVATMDQLRQPRCFWARLCECPTLHDYVWTFRLRTIDVEEHNTLATLFGWRQSEVAPPPSLLAYQYQTCTKN